MLGPQSFPSNIRATKNISEPPTHKMNKDFNKGALPPKPPVSGARSWDLEDPGP